ncbi:RagB/SusD family nutrient uptake outer membrane protein [Hymenobacter cellulosivorans]|uniref:RagB/SusD family nutrient uptake outer membrane protein n=1 Tax=Hymenobacter cellulosivorans TaxID=2932249 RepID=A0ABY4F557_9BACT|nr:RagB/SusD family nutrient uptake outer membrane protein [Hymenobacter cellulosivorans]UOQ51183.1 RagB/SusD family nutrient uptake outer membrane protein [Hymenobacter cellulosivorans]
MKRPSTLLLAALVSSLAFTTSCKDFLEEELVSTLTNDYYETEQGLEDLVKAAYEPTRFKYANEHSYAMFNFGTDEFTHADQVNYIYWNTYDRNRLNTGNGIESFVHDVWTADYDGINRCNIGIEKIPLVNGTSSLATPTQKTQRVAELRFLRAYYYFQLVQQYGAIPVSTKATESVQLEYTRTPVPEVYRLIVSDLRFAADNLSATTSEFGRATKGAAQHYLAKVYLTRGSAVQDQRGQQATDIDSAAYYADQVITSQRFALESDFGKLWDISSYANSRAAQTSREIIFSTQFNNVTALAGRFGNRVHSYFTMFYEDQPGMARDLLNDRPFRRLMATNYTMDIYDRKNDSRFYKSFKTAWLANNSATIPKWTAADAPTPALVGQNKFALGDTAIFIVVNTAQQTAWTEQRIARARYRTFARYYRTASGGTASAYDPTGPVGVRNKYPQLVKYIDPFRQGAGVNEEAGTRDGVLARLAETYLIAAEAYGRKGDYSKALTYINTLRNRAAYKAGEVKPTAFSLVEGGTRGDVSSTAAALQVTTAKFTSNDPAELYPASVTSQKDRFIHFILNERTRELAGELHRWEDLVRTETLVDRAKAFNPDTRDNIQAYHKLRPIPREHLERISRNGQPLNADQRQAEQNPGY